MMLAHFGLTRPPFEAPPDPTFLFSTSAHAEALATNCYVAQFGSRGAVTIGDSGLGKTTVALLAARKLNETQPIIWLDGRATGAANATAVWAERQALISPDSKAGVRTLPVAACQSLALEGRPGAGIVIDNADALPTDLWSWLLSWIDGAALTGGAANWLAFGTTRLAARLAQPRWDRLRQRVFRICTLRPLTAEEVAGFVAHRLRVAGGEEIAATLFSPAALQLIHRHSNGVPGVINQICDNALVEAFGGERLTIDAEHIASLVEPLGLAAAERAQNLRALPIPESRRLTIEAMPPDLDVIDVADERPHALPVRIAAVGAAAIASCALVGTAAAQNGEQRDDAETGHARSESAAPESVPADCGADPRGNPGPPGLDGSKKGAFPRISHASAIGTRIAAGPLRILAPESGPTSPVSRWIAPAATAARVPVRVRPRAKRERIVAALDELDRNAVAPAHYESRAHARSTLRGRPVVLEERAAHSASVLQIGTPRNISGGGLGLLLERFVCPGTECRVHVPELNDRPMWLFGRVARCRYLIGTAALYEVGIEFRASPEED